MKNRFIIIAAVCLFLIAAGVCYSCSYKRNDGQTIILSSEDKDDANDANDTDNPQVEDKITPDDSERQIAMDNTSNEPLIYVHICGAVINPGVYQVAEGSRIVDLIDAAGGLTPEAASDYINQAMEAEDEQRIYIPTKDEIKELGLDKYTDGDNNIQSDKESVKKVNINTADETELMSLPGIGQAKAKSIIEYRKKQGGFKDTSDLMNISGIKEGLFAQIEDLVIVE